jgi:hypothetical protein
MLPTPLRSPREGLVPRIRPMSGGGPNRRACVEISVHGPPRSQAGHTPHPMPGWTVHELQNSTWARLKDCGTDLRGAL